MALSDMWLRSVYGKAQDEVIEKSDRDGLSARISRLGKITFQVRFRINHKPARISIGVYPNFTLKNAREETLRLKAELEKGNDPRIVKKLEKKANIEAITVNGLFDMWFDAYCKRHYKHPLETKRNYDRHVSTALGDLPFDQISIHQWYAHFEKLANKYSTTTKSCLTICKSMGQWGVKRKLIESNPLIEIRAASDLKVKNNSVERVLTNEELRLLYEYIEVSEMRQSNKVLMQLILHFGCRGGELRHAKPQDFNFKTKKWTVPVENHKAGKYTGKPLVRPIIDEVAVLLKPFIKNCKTEYLFPATNGELMSRESLVGMPKMILKWFDRRNIEFEKWTVHDLRRTMRTRMSKLTSVDVAEIMLGHTLTQIRGIYDRYDYYEEQYTGYKAWWHNVQSILHPDEPDNVVPFRAGNKA